MKILAFQYTFFFSIKVEKLIRNFILNFQILDIPKSILSKTSFQISLKIHVFFNFLFVFPTAFENYWKFITLDTPRLIFLLEKVPLKNIEAFLLS